MSFLIGRRHRCDVGAGLCVRLFLTKRQRFTHYLIALLAGALLVLGFAPFHDHILGIVCPMVLFYLWGNHKGRTQRPAPTQPCKTASPFLLGLCFGLGLFGVGASWIYVSISTFGNTNIAISLLVTGLFVIIFGLYFAINGWLNHKLFKNTPLWLKLMIVYPTMWVLFEWLRSWTFLDGFPWLYIGYTQIHWPLGGFAPIGSVYLVSWLSLITSGILTYGLMMLKRYRHVYISLIMITILWLSGAALSKIQWTHPTGKPIKVALMQGNIAQSIKWQRGYFTHIIDTYTQLTENNWQPIIIWPENSIPAYASYLKNYLNAMTSKALKHQSAIVFGLPIQGIQHRQKYYNGAMVIGEGSGEYRKRHLVPFGEYIPLEYLFGPFFQFLHIPMSGFSSGPAQQKLLTIHGIPVAIFICYESAYPQEIRDYFQNAGFMITISDDSWFGQSLGIYQHEQMAQMRALETGRMILRDTNSGITSVINAHGDVIARATPFIKTVLISQVQPMTGTTPWVRFGLLPWLVLWLLLMGGIYFFRGSLMD